MSILIAPSDVYKTIQSAIDAASPGDTVSILPGNYNESLSIISKDNISLVASDYSGNPLNNYGVKFLSIIPGQTGLTIEANNTLVSGLRFGNYDTAVSVGGNNNGFIAVNCIAGGRGFSLSGNNNRFLSCVAEGNTIVGMNIIGNYNQIVGCRLDYNKRGIVGLSGSFEGNVFFKNFVCFNQETNIRISNPNADMNVYRENTISDSTYGLLANSGRVAIIANVFLQHSDAAILYKDNKGIILDNNFASNSTGLYADTCESIIAGNIVQDGSITGIIVNGSENTVISNTVTNYKCSGILVNGCKNNLCRNTLLENKINLICSSENNNINCCCNYCNGIACSSLNNVMDNLEIFNKPKECFCR